MTDLNNTAAAIYTTGTTTVGWTYSPNSGSGFCVVTPINQPKQEAKVTRGLYNVYVVDPATDEVVLETGAIIAKDEDNAQLKAVQMAGATLTEDIDDYDIVVVELGEVRAKKTVQEVKMVN